MTHEFASIIDQSFQWQKVGRKNILATVVDLDGSSYRKPGVRMLINDHGKMLGAVSGGCVEKEICHQAFRVIESGIPKIMTYDGRLRLGCEGVLFVLLEPIEISEHVYHTFKKALDQRIPILLKSFYQREPGLCSLGGTSIRLGAHTYNLHNQKTDLSAPLIFEETLSPLFRLLIIGAEHDAVQLCKTASNLGWEVHIVVAPDEQKTIAFFPGARQIHAPVNHQIDRSLVDEQTAIVLMTHSYTKDVYYLNALKNTYPVYFGLLGPKKRKAQLIDRLLDIDPELELAFIEQFRGPAGINIGAASAQEIAISILAEILAVTRQQDPIPLKDKSGAIHD